MAALFSRSFCCLLLISPFAFVSSALSCYDASGNQNNAEMGVCDPDAQTSVCCGWTDTCLSNGLCRTAKNGTLTQYFYNGCTDDSFEAPECAVVAACKKIQGTLQGNGIRDCGDNDYCCYGYGDGCDCSNSTLVFTLPPGNIVATMPVSTAYSAFLSTAVTASASATSTTTNVASNTATTTSAAPPSTAPTSDDSHPDDLVGLGVGVGIGVPLLAAVAVGIWYLLRRRRTRGDQYARASQMPPDDHGDSHKDGSAYDQLQVNRYDGGGYQPMELDAHREPVQLDSALKAAREPSELPAER